MEDKETLESIGNEFWMKISKSKMEEALTKAYNLGATSLAEKAKEKIDLKVDYYKEAYIPLDPKEDIFDCIDECLEKLNK